MPRIIPVVDILGGRVVHAVAGRRSEYQPVVSQLTRSDDPVEIANALLNVANAKELYIADLDAILGDGLPTDVTNTLIQSLNCTILLDHGLRTVPCTDDYPAHVHPIIAGETFPSKCWPALQRLDPSRFLFSVDMVGGRLVENILEFNFWEEARMTSGGVLHGVIDRLRDRGVRRFILLDIADTGARHGIGTLDKCRYLRRNKVLDVELIVGGGVRDAGDLQLAAEAGADAVLVATALHRGDLP